MKAPSPFARLAGMPIFAVLLFICYGAVITGWSEGHLPWWLAVLAFLAALKTLKAVGEVRRYKIWLANWNAMDAQEQAPLRRKILTLNRVLLVIAGAAFLFLPLLRAPGTSDSALQQVMWVVSGLYLVFALVRFILRRIRKSSTAPAESESKPVSWLIDRASSAPSREDATEDLPDYCAGLLSSSAKQED